MIGPNEKNSTTRGISSPLKSRKEEVLERPGRTEATVDLYRMVGLRPYGVLCELTNPDGTMARMPQIMRFAEKHAITVVTAEDIIGYRRFSEKS